MNIYEKILAVQDKLEAPKSNYNDYGGYYYRSCEDIVQSVKPLLKEQGLLLIMWDNVEQLADNRTYVKATAELIDVDDPEARIKVTASAREPFNRKGMDDSQITGASSSYARKYALNGLFAIDDENDPDKTNLSDDPNGPTEKKYDKPKSKNKSNSKSKNKSNPKGNSGGISKKKMREKQMESIVKSKEQRKKVTDKYVEIMKERGHSSLEKLTDKEWNEVFKQIKGAING